MKSNYEPLGKHIRLVDYRNSEEVTSTVLGISIDKEFMRWDLSRIFSANNMQCC